MQNTTQYKIKNRKKRTAAETGFQTIENTSIICHAVPVHQSRKAVKTFRGTVFQIQRDQFQSIKAERLLRQFFVKLLL